VHTAPWKTKLNLALVTVGTLHEFLALEAFYSTFPNSSSHLQIWSLFVGEFRLPPRNSTPYIMTNLAP